MGDRGDYRGIYVALVDDPDFQALSAHARAVFYPLKLKLGRAGIAVFYPVALPVLTGFDQRTCEGALEELRRGNWLQVEGNVYWLRNGLLYDPVDPLASPKGRKGIENWLKTLPRLQIVADFAAYYSIPFEGASKPPASPFDPQMTETETETEKETETETDPTEAAAASSTRAPTEANGSSGNDEEGLRLAMAALVDAEAATIDNDLARKRFIASASPLVDGSDYVAWQDKTGSQIPWPDRPNLLKLALAHRAATGNALRSALRYVTAQQLDPFPLKSNNGPPPGSPAYEYRNGDPEPERRNVKRSGLMPIDSSSVRSSIVQRWASEHPDRAAELRTKAEDSVERKDRSESMVEALVRGAYESLVFGEMQGRP